jgi:hypothetical protein
VFVAGMRGHSFTVESVFLLFRTLIAGTLKRCAAIFDAQQNTRLLDRGVPTILHLLI